MTAEDYVQPPLPGFEDDADYATTRQQRTAQLRAQNRELVQELHGLGGVVDLGAVAMLHVQALIDLALTPDERAELEQLFEARMGDALRNTVSNLRKARLTAPPAGPAQQLYRNTKDPNAAGAFFGP